MADYFLAFAAAFALSSATFFLSASLRKRNAVATLVVSRITLSPVTVGFLKPMLSMLTRRFSSADLIEEADGVVKTALDRDIDGNFSVKLLKRFGARPKK